MHADPARGGQVTGWQHVAYSTTLEGRFAWCMTATCSKSACYLHVAHCVGAAGLPRSFERGSIEALRSRCAVEIRMRILPRSVERRAVDDPRERQSSR